MAYPLPFGVNSGVKQKQSIASIYKCIGQAVWSCFNVCRIIHQGIVCNLLHQAQIEYRLLHAQILGNPTRSLQFDGVALPILKSDGLHIFTSICLNCLNQAGC